MELAWLVPALPFAAFAIVGLFLLRAANLASFLVIGATAASCAISYLLFFRVMAGETYEAQFPWLALSPAVALPFGIHVDPLSALMLIVVTTVALLVQIYSRGYMWEPEEKAHEGEGHPEASVTHSEAGEGGLATHDAVTTPTEHGRATDYGHDAAHAGTAHGGAHHGPPPPLVRDPGFARYFAYLGLFTAAMLGLVLANNLLVIYLFWEGVGLGSYLLIGFWYKKPSAAMAAKKAFVTTRFGDFGFLLGILYLFWQTGTLEFAELAAMAETGELTTTAATIGGLLVFMGAVGKSAQFPLHVWLPDAMEGPTPVSALIHAATMVAAGVYLVARLLPVYEHAPVALLTVAFIGGFTAIFAASMGLVATDIKRVMAFSTVSQLGYMMLGLGAGVIGAGMFHLFTHAFFKALLFLTAGSVIYILHRAGAHDPEDIDPLDPPRAQDLRYMGGMLKRTPITAWAMIIAALSLAGIPPLAGFWSKDEILLVTFEQATHGGGAIYWVLFLFAMITVFMTAFYMFRVIFLTFFGEYRGPADAQYIREAPASMTVPLLILIVPSILVGFWGAPPLGNPFGQYLEGADFHLAEMSIPLAAVSTLLALAGIGLAYAMYLARSISAEAVAARFAGVYTTLLNRYWIDELYCWLMDKFIIAVAFGAAMFDRSVIDGIVNGVARGVGVAGDGVRALQTGRIPAYALAVFAGVALIALWAVVLRNLV
ncbi:MAG: NADH-quinone oxidoreductase subunit L [Chloroflexota bacterium]|nr:NADH-quinone oxidoreductase subunit L [Chloroflexota bacterium]